MATKIQIVNAVAVRLGEEAPQSLSDDTDVMAAIDRIYDVAAAEFLCRHAWSFARKSQLLTAPVALDDDHTPWEYTFVIPGDCLVIRDVLLAGSGVPIAYELRDGQLLARRDSDLLMIYTTAVGEELWPPDFAAAVTEEVLGQALEAFEEWTRGAEIRANAEMKLRRSNTRDRGQRPGGRAVNPRMLRVWRGATAGRA